MAKADWEIRAEKCQKITKDSINPEWILPASKLPPAEQLDVTTFVDGCGFLSPEELEITNCTATELVSRMGAGKLTATKTVTAFLKRAHIGHQLLNFATEFMVEDALKRAAALDAHFTSTGQLVGPLHGVPISVKEHVGLKGRVCNASYAALTDNVPEEDALLVRLLANAGAVFHVRTNTPQSLMVSISLLSGTVLLIVEPTYLADTVSTQLAASRLQQQLERDDSQPLQPQALTGRLQRWRGGVAGFSLFCSWDWHRHWRIHQGPCSFLRGIRLPPNRTAQSI